MADGNADRYNDGFRKSFYYSSPAKDQRTQSRSSSPEVEKLPGSLFIRKKPPLIEIKTTPK